MDMTQLLGRPLSQVELWLAEEGLSPRIVLTGDPRHPREEGTLRVLRASESELVVARFLDDMPKA